MQSAISQYCDFLCAGTTGVNRTVCTEGCAMMENTPISQAMIYYPLAKTSDNFVTFYNVTKNNLNRLINEVVITNIIYIYYPIITIIFFLVAIAYFIGYISLMLTLVILFVSVLILIMYGAIYNDKLENFVDLHIGNIGKSIDAEFLDNAQFKQDLFTELFVQWQNSTAKPN